MKKSNFQDPNLEDEFLASKDQIDFGAIFEIFIRRKKIFVLLGLAFFLIATSNLIYRRVKQPIYKGSFTLMISDPFINNRTQNNSIEDLALNKEILDIPTLVQYLKSPGVVSNIAKKNNISPMSLINRIRISVPQNSGTLGRFLSKTLLISLEGENKFRMRSILNDLSEQYITNASESRNEKLSEGIKFLNNQKPKLLLKVRDAQTALESFRLKNKIIDPSSEGVTITKLIEQNQNDILTLESENMRLIFIRKNLENGILYTQGINSSSNSAGLGIIGSDQLLLKEILDVKSQLANAQSKYKQSSTIVKNLKAKLSQLEPILLKNQKSAVEAAITVNNSLIKSSENKLNELRKKFITIPKKVTEYSTIIQNLKTLENNLKTLNETKDKLELDLSQGTLPWKILKEPSVSPYPIKPEIKKNLIYILLSTFIFSSIITYLIERLDDVFHNPKEVEKFINLPVIGFVPFFNFNLLTDEGENEKYITINDLKANSKSKLSKNIKFIFEETFRNIYTSIKFSKSDQEIKIVNITSSVPSEGKSLCSLFLALNASQLTKNVLIVDTDLRKPSLHKRLEVDNIKGISNYLVSSDKDFSEYICKHTEYKNLSYLTAGKIPPNSISLLESKKMNSFIEELRKSNKYDLIILDCPPLLGLSDALIITSYSDATLLTISLNKVKKNLAQECMKKLTTIDKNIIGTIVNSVNDKSNNNSFGNDYYSYSNKYGYYAYQYMPIETQKRYLEGEEETNLRKNNLKNKFKNKTLLEKAKLILNKIRIWLDE